MLRALVLTEWTTAPAPGGGSGNVPRLDLDFPRRDYPDLRWSDVTGQPTVPTQPNLVLLEVTCSESTLGLIEAAYGAEAILAAEAA